MYVCMYVCIRMHTYYMYIHAQLLMGPQFEEAKTQILINHTLLE